LNILGTAEDSADWTPQTWDQRALFHCRRQSWSNLSTSRREILHFNYYTFI